MRISAAVAKVQSWKKRISVGTPLPASAAAHVDAREHAAGRDLLELPVDLEVVPRLDPLPKNSITLAAPWRTAPSG